VTNEGDILLTLAAIWNLLLEKRSFEHSTGRANYRGPLLRVKRPFLTYPLVLAISFRSPSARSSPPLFLLERIPRRKKSDKREREMGEDESSAKVIKEVGARELSSRVLASLRLPLEAHARRSATPNNRFGGFEVSPPPSQSRARSYPPAATAPTTTGERQYSGAHVRTLRCHPHLPLSLSLSLSLSFAFEHARYRYRAITSPNAPPADAKRWEGVRVAGTLKRLITMFLPWRFARWSSWLDDGTCFDSLRLKGARGGKSG